MNADLEHYIGLISSIAKQYITQESNENVIDILRNHHEISTFLIDIAYDKTTSHLYNLIMKKKIALASVDSDAYKLIGDGTANSEIPFINRLTKALIEELNNENKIVSFYQNCWKIAIESDNELISRSCVYYLTETLIANMGDETREKHADLYMQELHNISIHAINIDATKHNYSVYHSTYMWFFSLFYSDYTDYNVHIYFLQTASYYVVECLRRVINHDVYSIFENFVEYAHDGVVISSMSSISWANYEDVIVSCNNESDKKTFSDIKNNARNIYDYKALQEWKSKFRYFNNKIKENLNDKHGQLIELEKNEKSILVDVENMYKLNHLREMIFVIGTWCVFKERYKYIYELWTYKQPPDSSAHWAGVDILPVTPDDLMRLYFDSGLNQIELFRVGHHSMNLYKKKYFLYSLAWLLSNSKIKKPDKKLFEDYDNSKRSRVKSETEDIIKLSASLLEDAQLNIINSELFRSDQDIEQLCKDVNSYLKEVVKSFGKLKEEEIVETPISENRINEFYNEFYKSFKNHASFRNLMKLYSYKENLETFCNKIGGENDKDIEKKPRFGLNYVHPKEAFFDKWPVSYTGYGGSFGEQLAESENIEFYKKLVSENLEEMRISELSKRCRELKHPVLFASNISMWSYFGNLNEYETKWRMSKERISQYSEFNKNGETVSIPGFAGLLKYSNCKPIPVIYTNRMANIKCLLLLDMSRFGKLIQYNPLNSGEDKSHKKDIFYYRVADFSKNTDVINDFLVNPPRWLKKVDESEWEDHLKKNVLINIFQRFEFEIANDFVGYFIKLDDV